MDNLSDKYNENIFSRYFILKEGIFKNTKKILNIYNDSLMIENADESEREIIIFENIENVSFAKDNQKEFSISYRGSTELNDLRVSKFSSVFRTQIIADILNLIDISSKIHHYPVETFKSLLMFEETDEFIVNFTLKDKGLQNKMNSISKSNMFEITFNVHRAIIELSNLDSKRETRIRLSDIESIKIYEDCLIHFEMNEKIDLYFIPKKPGEAKIITEKITENCRIFLGYEIILEFFPISEFKKVYPLPKTIIFSYSNIYRRIYDMHEKQVKIIADTEYIYEVSEEEDGLITKINKIPLQEIIYLICSENRKDYFEIFLKNKTRFVYKANNNERNIIVTNILDIISEKYKKSNDEILLLSYKPKIELKIIGFINDEVDVDYENCLLQNLQNLLANEKSREKIIEDICINFCFKTKKFRMNSNISKKFLQGIYEIIPYETNKLIELQRQESNFANNKIFSKRLSAINYYLIIIQRIIKIFHSEKVISELFDLLESNSSQILFYNVFLIYKNLLPSSSKNLKKDEIAQRKWMISSHFDNAVKIKNILFNKIFDCKTKQKNPNFEENHIIPIYILMELQKNIYQFSKEINTLNEIIKEFNTFDFLYILYILMQCGSNIMKKISIEILIILLKNLPYEQEFKLKSLILSRTLIILSLLSIYFKPPNEVLRALALKFLKSFLISHVEATNLIINLFPMTLFYHVYKDKKPNPINWLDHEWENFFLIVLKDTQSTQLIWNQNCRNELLESISVLTSRYESFTDDKLLVHSLNLDVEYVNTPYDRDEGISGIKKTESLQMENSLSNKFGFPQFSFSNLNVSYYCLNYKEIKFEYLTLKKHVFVWQYYLKKLINESLSPNFNQHIDKPKKFWNKLMNELINTFNENKILLIIKTLTLLYKYYSEIIGPFKEYKYFINIFSSSKNVDIKIMIVHLFCVTLENEEKEIKEPNLKNLIETQVLEHLLNFISELNSIEKVKENNLKHLNYEKTIEYLSKNNSKVGSEFLDSKENFLKNIIFDFDQDKDFPLYSHYNYIDKSWNGADKPVKTCTLIVNFLKKIMKRFAIVNGIDFKINFPIPQVKLIFFDPQNYLRILSLLYIDNENIILETLDLIIHFMNDPLTYKMVLHSTNTIDILIYFMIKYKSKNIMNFIDNMYYYHNVFFSFDFLKKTSNDNSLIMGSPSTNLMSYRKDSIQINTNNTDVLNVNNSVNSMHNYCYISDDEFDFFENYQAANKFLCRYFPISLINHLINSDFLEFIETLQATVYKSNLIWNAEMLKKLIINLTELLRNYILFETPNISNENLSLLNANLHDNYEQNLKIMNFNCLKTNNINSLYSNNPLHSYKEFELKNFAFDPKFKIDYKIISERLNCFIYYFDLFIYKKSKINDLKEKKEEEKLILRRNSDNIPVTSEETIKIRNSLELDLNTEDINKSRDDIFDILNVSIEKISIFKACEYKLELKIDPNHYQVICRSIIHKIKKMFLTVKNMNNLVETEFIIFLKSLKFMIKKLNVSFLEEMKCLVEIFKELTITDSDKEKEIENYQNVSSSFNSGNLNVDVTAKNLNNCINERNSVKNDLAIKIILYIFLLHYEKIEQNGLPLFSGNQSNQNSTNKFSFNFNNIPNTVNNPLSESSLKMTNQILSCIFIGSDYFSTKYISRNLKKMRDSEKKNNKSDSNYNAELKIINKILIVFNKYNFLKSKYNIFGMNLQSPKNLTIIKEQNQTSPKNQDISENKNNTYFKEDQVMQYKVNIILQKFMIKYSDVKNLNNKSDLVDEILEKIEVILKNFEFILYKDVIEKIQIKILDDNFLIENSDYYLEILKFFSQISNNSGFTLLFIKNGVYLFNLFFMLKYKNKSFKIDKMLNFANELSKHSFFILRNLINFANGLLKSHKRSASGNNFLTSNPQLNNHIMDDLQNPSTIKLQKSDKMETIPNAININKHEIHLLSKLSKIYFIFDRVMRNIFKIYFYNLLANHLKNAPPLLTNTPSERINKEGDNINQSYSLSFLDEFKSDIENPDFIWNKNYRKEIKNVLIDLLKKLAEKKFNVDFSLNTNANINSINVNTLSFSNGENSDPKANYSNLIRGNSSNINNIIDQKSENETVNIDHLENLQGYEYLTSKKELKIGKIFIRVYNKMNNFTPENPNQFLENLKQKLLDIKFENFNIKDFVANKSSFDIKRSSNIININPNKENRENRENQSENLKKENEIDNPYLIYDDNLNINYNIVDELLKAISNVINNSKADETILLKDVKFVEKFYKLLNENINFNKDIKEKLRLENNFDENKTQEENQKLKVKGQINIFSNFKSNLNRKFKNSNLEIDKENLHTLLGFNQSNNEDFSNELTIIDLIPSCLNLLYILSMINPESMKFVLNHNIIFILLKIINSYNSKYHIDPIIRVLRLINKNPEFVDKLNLSIFLFLLKKIVSFRELNTIILEEEKMLNKAIDKVNNKITIERISEENTEKSKNLRYMEQIKEFQGLLKILKENYEKINQLGIDIIKIIKKFINNERIGFAIKGIFEFYLPNKIIDGLFFTKDTNENSFKCLGEELELPDLIWNKEAIQQSKKILDEDTIFILNDELNLDNFPQNLITHKLSPQKCFFFEISDEYRLDNIYIRIFNKYPAYNLGKNLIIFFKQVFNDSINNYKKLAFFQFLKTKPNLMETQPQEVNNAYDMKNYTSENYFTNESLNKMVEVKHKGKLSDYIIENLKKQIQCGFTAILLMIEQINFNDYNDNLGISSAEEMKNLIKDENEKNLISLVQRSFEYQMLLSHNFILKLTDLILSSLGINEEKKNRNLIEKFLLVDENIRLIFLQILYLLTVNKKAINLIYEKIEINELLHKFFLMEETVTDAEFVILLIITYKLICHDLSKMSGFITLNFDKYVDLQERRNNLTKYVQLIFIKILNDSQYGESMINLIKLNPEKYRNFHHNLSQKLNYYETFVSSIWRNCPETKEQATLIYKYKIEDDLHFIDDLKIQEKGTYYSFEGRFPILPISSISHFSVKEISEINYTKLFNKFMGNDIENDYNSNRDKDFSDNNSNTKDVKQYNQKFEIDINNDIEIKYEQFEEEKINRLKELHLLLSDLIY